MLADWGEATHIESGRAPFSILVLIVGLRGHVRNEVVRVNGKSSLDSQFVPVAPVKHPVFPIEIRTISVRHVKAGFQGEIQRSHREHSIVRRSIWSSDIAI